MKLEPNKPLLLAIDDEEANLSLTTEIIVEHLPDCKVITSISAQNGLVLARQYPVDVALIDVAMPTMDGIELCRQMKADTAIAHIQIILITGFSWDSDLKAAGLAAGAIDFICKPFERVEFVARIKTALRISKIESDLRENQEKYRSLINNIPDVIWTSDSTGNTVFISDNVTRCFGYTPQEIYESGKQVWFERVHPDDVDTLRRSFRELFTEQKNFDLEYRIQRRDGQWVWLHDRAITTYTENGTEFADGVFSDITDRKRIQEVLRESEVKHRRLIETMNEGFAVTDPDMTLKFVNQRMCDMLDYKYDKIIGRNVSEFVDETNRRKLINALSLHDAESEARHEVTFTRKNGSALMTQVSPKSLSNSQTNFIGCFSIITDITALKKAEEELKAAHDQLQKRVDERTASLRKTNALLEEEISDRREVEGELRESQKRLKLAIKASNIGLWTWDWQTDDVYFSTRWKSQLGYEEDELANRFEEWETRLHPEDREHVFSRIRSFKQSQSAPYDTEFRMRHKDGSYRWIYANGDAYPDIDGTPRTMMGCHIDITGRKEYEVQIRDSLTEKKILLQEIHHRVKNNLQIVASLLTIQAKKINHEPAAKCLLDNRDRIRSMAIIHEMLYGTADLANVELAKYIPKLVSKLQQTFEVDLNRVEFSYDIENLCIEIDQAIPCGLIINELVANSLSYAFPNEGRGRIKLGFRNIRESAENGTSDVFELTVSDDGIGISENVELKNCDTFGLHLVYLLAKNQLEGDIEMIAGKGITFKVTFSSET